MKFAVTIVLTMLLGYVTYVFNDTIPWWGIAIGAFLAGLAVPQKAWHSWLAGFTGMVLLWGILAAYINEANKGLLAARMAQILPFDGNTNLLLLATALVGGLVGGFSALSGNYLRKSRR
jgi:hypothetical protein